MDANAVTESSFTRSQSPTWDLLLPNGTVLRVVKNDEDCDCGYHYTLSVVKDGNQTIINEGWFDGFGFDDRPNDIIHSIRAYISSL